jgi:hypothetical protein
MNTDKKQREQENTEATQRENVKSSHKGERSIFLLWTCLCPDMDLMDLYGEKFRRNERNLALCCRI